MQCIILILYYIFLSLHCYPSCYPATPQQLRLYLIAGIDLTIINSSFIYIASMDGASTGKDSSLDWMRAQSSGTSDEDLLTGKVRLDATDAKKQFGLANASERDLYSMDSASFMGAKLKDAKSSTLMDASTASQPAKTTTEVATGDKEVATGGALSQAMVDAMRAEIRERVRAVRAKVKREDEEVMEASLDGKSVASRVSALSRGDLDALILRALRHDHGH